MQRFFRHLFATLAGEGDFDAVGNFRAILLYCNNYCSLVEVTACFISGVVPTPVQSIGLLGLP